MDRSDMRERERERERDRGRERGDLQHRQKGVQTYGSKQ